METNRNRSSSGWLALPASSSTRMLNCSQLTSRLTKRAGLLRKASISGTETSASVNSLISFIVFDIPILLTARLAAIGATAIQSLCGDAAGDGAALGQCQPVHEVGQQHDFLGGALH